MTPKRLPFSPRSVVMALILFLMVGAVVGGYRQSRSTVRNSAAALAAQICAHLQAVPVGGRYPGSLTDLALTFPDGGEVSLLQFSYHSSGTSCTLRVHLPQGELQRSFP